MKKIILFISLLVFGSMVYGGTPGAERGSWGMRYPVESGTILYYSFGTLGNAGGGKMTCVATDYVYNRKDATFEVINDGMFWFGSPSGAYKLNDTNNYRVTITFNNISALNAENGGNVIFTSLSTPKMIFLLQCDYQK